MVVQFKVSAVAKSVALNILVSPVASYGHRMDQAIAPAVIDTGKYRHGFVMTDRFKLKSGGLYVVTISSFTPGQVANFQLQLSSSRVGHASVRTILTSCASLKKPAGPHAHTASFSKPPPPSLCLYRRVGMRGYGRG